MNRVLAPAAALSPGSGSRSEEPGPSLSMSDIAAVASALVQAQGDGHPQSFSACRRALYAVAYNVVDALQRRLLLTRALRHIVGRHLALWRLHAGGRLRRRSEAHVLHGFSSRHLLGGTFDHWRARAEELRTLHAAIDLQRLEAYLQKHGVPFSPATPRSAPRLRQPPSTQKKVQLSPPAATPSPPLIGSPFPSPRRSSLKPKSVDAIVAGMHATARQTRRALDRWMLSMRGSATALSADGARRIFEAATRLGEPRRRPLQPFELDAFTKRCTRRTTFGAIQRWLLTCERAAMGRRVRSWATNARLIVAMRGLAWHVIARRRRSHTLSVADAARGARLRFRARRALEIWNGLAISRALLERNLAIADRQRWLTAVHGSFTEWEVRGRSAADAAESRRERSDLGLARLELCRLRERWQRLVSGHLLSAHVFELHRCASIAYRRMAVYGALHTMRVWSARRRYRVLTGMAGMAAARERALTIGLARLRALTVLASIGVQRARLSSCAHVRTLMRTWRRVGRVGALTVRRIEQRRHAALVTRLAGHFGEWAVTAAIAQRNLHWSYSYFREVSLERALATWRHVPAHARRRWEAESRSVELEWHGRLRGYIGSLAAVFATWHSRAERSASEAANRDAHSRTVALRIAVRSMARGARLHAHLYGRPARGGGDGALGALSGRMSRRQQRVAFACWRRHAARMPQPGAMADAINRRARHMCKLATDTWRWLAVERRSLSEKLDMAAQMVSTRREKAMRHERSDVFFSWALSARRATELARRLNSFEESAGVFGGANSVDVGRGFARWRATTHRFARLARVRLTARQREVTSKFEMRLDSGTAVLRPFCMGRDALDVSQWTLCVGAMCSARGDVTRW